MVGWAAWVVGRGLGLDLLGGRDCFEPEPVSESAPNIVGACHPQ